jgi:hypothetical protein
MRSNSERTLVLFMADQISGDTSLYSSAFFLKVSALARLLKHKEAERHGFQNGWETSLNH